MEEKNSLNIEKHSSVGPINQLNIFFISCPQQDTAEVQWKRVSPKIM